MTISVSPAVARALALAQAWAGAEAPSGRHVLAALIREEDGRPALLLQEHGLDVAALRANFKYDHAILPAPSDPPDHISFESPLIYSARCIARDIAGDDNIATEHLLLALVQDDAEVRPALEDLGLMGEELQTRFQAVHDAPLALDEPLQLTDATDAIDLARILDVNANRAREGLRVLEDYARFVLDDAFLSREFKQLRHDLAAALAEIPGQLLLEGRETQFDVGTGISTPSEAERHSLLAVVQANAKRLQESLRSLEEYGKVHSSTFGRAVESIRYRSYTLERALILGSAARDRLAEARLYVLLTGSLCTASMEWTIQEAAAGGATIFQLREKHLPDRELMERAQNVRRWTRAANVLFIMNDRPDIARLVDADGVHVGQAELSVKDVRRIVGPNSIVGVSTHNLEQLRQAIRDGASYIGVGPTFESGTKDIRDLAGLDFVRQATNETSLPAFAIGGITAANVNQVVVAGLRRVAVSQAICQADDPCATAAEFMRHLQSS